MGIELRQHAVEVFAESMLIHGRISTGRRLTDLVNEDEPYLNIDGVHIFPYLPDAVLGLNEHSRGMINKSSIVLLAELSQQPRQVGADGVGLQVVKDPHRVLIYADQFAVNAYIHLAPGVELSHMLGQAATRFIPLTAATVTPTQPHTQLTSFRRDFMLVNAAQIQYLGGMGAHPAEGEAPSPGQVEDGNALIG